MAIKKMEGIDDAFREGDFSFQIKAGPGTEDSDDEAYRFNAGSLPKWVKSVDDLRYNALMSPLYEAAAKIAKTTGIHFTLEGSIKRDYLKRDAEAQPPQSD